MTTPATVTYKCLIAGSTVHLQTPPQGKDGVAGPLKTAVFYGKVGGIGYYSTSDAEEIAQLDKLAANPQVQIEKVEADLPAVLAAPDAETFTKPADPALAAAAAEVTAQAASAVDPKLVAAQEGLAAMIKSAKSSN